MRQEEIDEFKRLIDKYRYDFCKLVFIIFPFGEPGHEMEHMRPREWQMREWRKLSDHLANPATRYQTYRKIISSGNGANKTAWGAMTFFMLMYTQQVRARITANTDPQMKSVIWPEYDIWYRRARYSEYFFEKLGTSIKSRDEKKAETWRLDTFNWSEEAPAAISGLHNYGKCTMYIFEEAPGIPYVIWKYAEGAFTEQDTIKIHLAFGNSDDPESAFEANMASPEWDATRIDTRTLDYIDQNQIAKWLRDAGGDEDHDDFRVRVRGLPRKSSRDSIIAMSEIDAALSRAAGFDARSIPAAVPRVLTCDPAWTGGDDISIWIHAGHWSKLLEVFKLDKGLGDTHQRTYERLCHWEREHRADRVLVDQAEGSAVYTLAINEGKNHWELISFANSPNDTIDPKDSQYANMRAQMYYMAKEHLQQGAVIECEDPAWVPLVRDQFCWTKGTRHRITLKKLAEPKADIRERTGKSPDLPDGFVLRFSRRVTERLLENSMGGDSWAAGTHTIPIVSHSDPYAILNEDVSGLYR